MLAVVVSAAVVLAGVYLLLTPDAAGVAAFGWLFVVLGVAGGVMTLVLRARTRRAGHSRGPERRT